MAYFVYEKIESPTHYYIHNTKTYYYTMFGKKIFTTLKTNKNKAIVLPFFGMPILKHDDEKNPEILMEYMKNYRAHDLDLHNYSLITSEMCEKLVSEYPECIKNIPLKFITNDLCKKIIDKNPNNIVHIPIQCLTDEICDKVINMHPGFFDLLPIVKQTSTRKKMVNEIYKSFIKYRMTDFDVIPEEHVDYGLIHYALAHDSEIVSYDSVMKHKHKLYPHEIDTLQKLCFSKINHSLLGNKYNKYPDSYCYNILKEYYPKSPE